MRTVRGLSCAVILGTALAGVGLSLPAAAATNGHSFRPAMVSPRLHSYPTRHLCPAAVPRTATCNAVTRTGIRARRGLFAARTAPSGYGPADLTGAYRLPAATAVQSSRTVAIVDAHDDPRAESDLAVYRAQFGLPACTTANGCFRKVDQNGGTRYPTSDAGWAGEISLDVDMVSAICPTCRILLVEASSNSLADLGTGVNQAVALGARYVSNSYGGPEFASETSADSYYHHPGVAITVSSGDAGYGVEYPAASPYVTAVGGTTLTRSTAGRGWSETAWSGAGSGCSSYEPKPVAQSDNGCTRRSVADVAAVADPRTGVAGYNTYGAGGWQVYGGTSAAAPIIAAVYALGGLPGSTDLPSSYGYDGRGALNDVTSGSNGSCGGSYLCTAEAGYDGPTGLGTPWGTVAFTHVGPPRPLPARIGPYRVRPLPRPRPR